MNNYIPAYLATPQLEDALIQQLRVKLHSDHVSWLQYCLHKVERYPDNEGREFAFYRLNIGEDREYIAAPDTSLESLMFFEINSADYSQYVGNLSRYNISIYCWINKDKVTTANEDITLFYCEKVVATLRKYFRVEAINRTTRRNDVFDYSGLQTNEFKPMLGKFCGFRINCDIYHDDHSCYNISHMPNAIPQIIPVTFTSANVVDGVATLTHTGNSTRVTDITVRDPNGKLLQLLSEPKPLTLTTVEFGISIGAGTYTAYIEVLPMLT